MTTPEFLPLCDVLFNIISLASYFCDVVFDVITVYTLFADRMLVWFTLALCSVVVSLVTCQVCSIKWYMCSVRVGEVSPSCGLPAVVTVHALQFGALWRYFKLFIPVDLRHVKQEVRDLCVLRMMHGFCQAAPMLLIQLYLIWLRLPLQLVSRLNVVSTVLSLFSVCWALASYNKNVRQHNMHKLVLTWLGVIFQLLWRLGTVTSRALALTVYATLFDYYVFLVIGLHWLTMFLWLISPKNVFHGEGMTRARKVVFAAAIAYVYTFCYINFQESKSRQKMVVFYSVMLLENTLLVAVWMAVLRQQQQPVWYDYVIVCTVFASFAVGVLFMALYYQYFHINKLNYARAVVDKTCLRCRDGSCADHKPKENLYANLTTELGGRRSAPPPAADQPPAEYARLNGQHAHVIGVFNCRFNPQMMKRKKKKPTTFVPPPPVAALPSVAFWRRPLPRPGHGGSDHEGSTVSSRVNIQQKLQEKKQQQLAELRVIEEEIKQGKLARPRPAELYAERPPCQPIPPQKRPPWIRPAGEPAAARSRTPEVLLAPHFLHSRVYYEPDAAWPPPADDDADEAAAAAEPGGGGGGGRRRGRRGRGLPAGAAVYKSCRVPSDVDSQISLPRSYTLPREFRYYRQARGRGKPAKTGQYVCSNSSDGDVDSENEADNETMLRNSMLLHQQAIRPRPYLPRRHGVGYPQHETQL